VMELLLASIAVLIWWAYRADRAFIDKHDF
jgi:hypothetical protein